MTHMIRTPYQQQQADPTDPAPIAPVIVAPATPAPQVAPPKGDGDGISPYERELRNENAKHRVALHVAEEKVAAALKEAETLKATLAAKETEYAAKLTETATKLEIQFKENTFKAKVKAEAAAVLLDPSELDRLDLSGVTLEADGSLKGLTEFLKDLEAKRPYYFKSHYASPSSTSGRARSDIPAAPGSPPVFNALTAKKEESDAAIKAYLKASKK